MRGDRPYTPDLRPADLVQAVFVRSLVPHARVTSIDTREADEAPGVVGVFTAIDLDLGALVPFGATPDGFARPPLSSDVVRYVGDPVAVVVAETTALAEEAALLVEIEYEDLPALVDPEEALDPAAPVVFPEHGSNLVIRGGHDDDPDVLTGADVVVTTRFVSQRLAPVPMEPNAAVAETDGEGRVSLWTTTQAPFAVRAGVATSLGLPPEDVRVITPAVGGGFGAKGDPYPEHCVVAGLAMRISRPVAWVEGRMENLINMSHGRGQIQSVELGARHDGRLVGLRARIVADAGAYPVVGAWLPDYTVEMAAGPYSIPKVCVTYESVVTNTTPVGAYRGAGRPEAVQMLESTMDVLARRLDMDRVELRRRNLLPAFRTATTTATGAVYDSGDYPRAMDRALEAAQYNELTAERDARLRGGDTRVLGVGVANYVEVTVGKTPKHEWASVEITPSEGRVEALVGTSSHGQGHVTAYSQIIADALGVDPDGIDVIHSDTGRVAWGGGTFGSRSLQLGGSSLHDASVEVLTKARRVAAHALEAREEDIVIVQGKGLAVAGTPDSLMTWAELAATAADPALLPADLAPGLAAQIDRHQDGLSYVFGTHVSLVEVDTETGEIELLRHVAVDDCGRIVNPLLAEGQIHGGIAQGVSQALLESFVYDDAGYPLTGSLLSYAMPLAEHFPSFDTQFMETPTPLNPLGAKGVGEAGTTGSTAAIYNAVLDALAPYGVERLDMPFHPERVWRALSGA